MQGWVTDGSDNDAGLGFDSNDSLVSCSASVLLSSTCAGESSEIVNCDNAMPAESTGNDSLTVDLPRGRCMDASDIDGGDASFLCSARSRAFASAL